MLIDETGLFRTRRYGGVKNTLVAGGDGGHRTKVPVIGAGSGSPAAQRLGFRSATDAGGYSSADKAVALRRDLLRPLRGAVVATRDGGPNHHGPATREVLKRNDRRRLERLPPDAPDRDPVAAVGSGPKWGPRAALAADDLTALNDWIVECVVGRKRHPELLRAPWGRLDLPFPDPPPSKGYASPANQ